MTSVKRDLRPFLRRIAAERLFEAGAAPFATDRAEAERDLSATA
jgi:hypothetical protein